jgi:hypothetical protein
VQYTLLVVQAMPGEWLTVAEASQRSGYNPEYLRQLMRRDAPPFAFMKVGWQYFIHTESFTAFCAARRQIDDDARYGPRRHGVDTDADMQ